MKTKKLVTNIIFVVVIVLIYGFTAFLIFTKINGGTIYLFNTRFDVVLTDSMSEKNENHLDFLEGTSQINAFDMVKSKKIDEDTEIKEKDIVLFTNPEMNNATVMHRIVQVIEEGNKLSFNGIETQKYKEQDCLYFTDFGSAISLTPLDVAKIELEFISPKEYHRNYSFNIGGAYYGSECVSTQIDDYYKHIVTCERPNAAPMKIFISTTTEIESYVTKLSFTRRSGEVIEFNANEYPTDHEGEYVKIYNPYYLYEIRGDKAKDSDGIFKRDALISKVDGVAPKMGYLVRFLTSIPGLLMLVGLGLITTIGSYFYNKAKEKELAEANSAAEERNKDEKEKDTNS